MTPEHTNGEYALAAQLWATVQTAATERGQYLMDWQQAPQSIQQAVITRAVHLFNAGASLSAAGDPELADAFMSASALALVEITNPLITIQT